jgi:hypothetical protein
MEFQKLTPDEVRERIEKLDKQGEASFRPDFRKIPQNSDGFPDMIAILDLLEDINRINHGLKPKYDTSIYDLDERTYPRWKNFSANG